MSNFTVDFVSPVEYEYLAAEISYEGQLVCRIRAEKAQLELEFFFEFRMPIVPLAVPLEEFMKLVSELAEEVKSLRAQQT